jgi:CheY-like chemotaxis protein
MAPGGTLTLRTRNLGSTQIEVQVEDTGAGMSAETLAQARDPFFTTKDVGKGTGLGLPIVDSIIKDHGGRMDIQSEPGHGTLVILRIPALAKPGQTDAPAQVSGEGGNQGALKVLVVDDDDLVRGSMESLLECLGHAVVTRPYGEDALAIIETGFIPDVVILDMDLPDLGGTRTLLRLRTMLPDVPVVIATGLVDRATLDLIDLHPGVSLLPKPFSAGALQQELDRLVVV